MKLTRYQDLVDDSGAVDGRWTIGKGRDVRYIKDGLDEETRLRAELIAAEPRAMVLSVTEKQSDQKRVSSIFKLLGQWSFDSRNRLQFEVERQYGRNDVLTLGSAWQINDAQELVYSWAQTRLKTKTNRLGVLTFRGAWDISRESQLVYTLTGDSDAAFRIRGAFQSKSLLAKEGAIRYQAGIEAAGKRSGTRTLTLFGKWKVSRNLALVFEIEYGDGRRKAIRFGGEFEIGKPNQIAVQLTSAAGKPLGVELILSREFLGRDTSAFIRLVRDSAESRAEAGVRGRW